MIKKLLFSLVLMACSYGMATAKTTLGSLFKNNMVLQQNTKAMFFGTATPGTTITIAPDWATEPTTCVADADGKWRIGVPTPKAEGFTPHKITCSDDGAWKMLLKDVLIGEVWIASGQSNMEMPCSGWGVDNPIHNVDSILQSAETEMYKQGLRMVTVPERLSRTEVETTTITWNKCSASTANSFSIVAYFFSTHLMDRLQIPIGIINASYGGSDVIAWMPQDVLAQMGVAMNDNVYSSMTQQKPAACYNDMIKPLIGYTTSGFIWYQGENNSGQTNYAFRLARMVEAWRNLWGQGDLPFYQVEIAPYRESDAMSTRRAITREQQTLATYLLPNLRVVGINDLILETETSQHPKFKLGVGQRLGNQALYDVYGYKDLKPFFPQMKSVRFVGKEARIKFTHCEDGFNIQDNIKGFEVSGTDGNMKTATAHVEGDEVVVTCSSIATPKAVNYCFRNFLLGNLKNKEGLPITPFRSNGSTIPAYMDTQDENLLNLRQAVLYSKEKKGYFIGGTNPGCTEEAAYKKYSEAFDAANKLYTSGTASSAQAKEAADELNALAMDIDNHSIAITPGYYYIVNAFSDFKARQKVEKSLLSDATTLKWGNFASNMLSCVFKIEDAGNGQWTIQSVSNQKYVGAATSSTGTVPMSDTPANVTFKNFGTGQWGIISGSVDMEFYADRNNNGSGTNGNITAGGTTGASGTRNTASSWNLRKITDPSEIEKFELAARKNQLKEAIDKCKAEYGAITVGKELGDVTQEVMDTYVATVKAVGEYVTLTDEMLAEKLATLEKASKTFLAARKKVEPMTWYYIQSQDKTLAGNALYMKSPNLTGCDKWAANDDTAAWGFYNSTTKKFEGEKNLTCMWRLVPIEGKENAYVLQNRATGYFLSKTLSKTLRGLTDEGQAFVINILGHAQVEIVSVDDAGNASHLPIYASTGNSIVNQAGGKDTPAAWNFVPVAEMEDIEITGTGNTITIACYPFQISNIKAPEGYTVNTYSLSTMPNEGAFGLSKKSEFKAGEPFFLEIKAIDESNTVQETVNISVTCPKDEEYVKEGQTVNGLVGILCKSNKKQKGIVYFNSKNEMKTTSSLSATIEGWTGYIDPTQIVNQEVPIDLFIGDLSGVRTVKYGEKNGDIYSTDGKLLRTNAGSKSLKDMPGGIYIVNGEKISNR